MIKKNNLTMLSYAILILNITLNAMDKPTSTQLNDKLVEQLQNVSFSELPPAIQQLVIKHTPVYLYLQAVRENDIPTTKKLLAQGVPVDARYNESPQSTPLMHAVVKGRREMVSVLLDHGANVNLQNEYGNSAKILACRNASWLYKNPGFARFDIAKVICLKEQIPVPEEVLKAERHWGAKLLL